MTDQTHLKNAPIKEAIIDFRVRQNPKISEKSFDSLKKLLKQKYPNSEKRNQFTSKLKIKSGKGFSHESEEKFHGFFFKSADKINVAQFRTDGFTFSRLKPYTHWKEVITETKRLWNYYRKAALPLSVTRIAVRYINNIVVPLPIMDFADYLTAPITIPENLPQDLEGFFSKVTFRDTKHEIYTTLIQTIEESRQKNKATIILDIDVFHMEDLPCNDNKIWSIFEQLHIIKNDTFFNSITDKTLGLFK